MKNTVLQHHQQLRIISFLCLTICTIFGTLWMCAMDENRKKLEAVFYCTETGAEPVRVWLKKLSKIDKKTIGEDIKTVQYGWPIGMPLVDSLGYGMWEVRSKLLGGRIARILFFMENNTMVLVNAFFKKTQKTPKSELLLARKRKNQFEFG